ncbi:MAG: DMT family transporter [Alphaproteobacteria bacterium]
MELWIPITIFAAFMQNVRSALQKHLKGRLSTSGATFSRFVFGAPPACLYLLGLLLIGGEALPGTNGPFLLFAAGGGLAQILGTALLVTMFSFRNFAVGTAFSKTETVQTAVFGIIILGEGVGAGALVGILVSLIGVVLISITRLDVGWRGIARQCLEPVALIGIGAGTMFGISATAYRAASLSLADGDFLIRAAFTLACVTTFQTLVMAVYMAWREPGQIAAVFRSWRVASVVGLSGMLGSAGWFTAMTLQNAAYVRALGQIELLFTFAVAYLFFRERATTSELLGILLISAGILFLVLLR